MKEKSHSNVTFVTAVFLARGRSLDMLHQFIKVKSHSNVTFVTTAVLERVP